MVEGTRRVGECEDLRKSCSTQKYVASPPNARAHVRLRVLGARRRCVLCAASRVLRIGSGKTRPVVEKAETCCGNPTSPSYRTLSLRRDL